MSSNLQNDILDQLPEQSATEMVVSWLKERANSGLFVTYLVYWVYFNWKFVVLLVFDSKPGEIGRILNYIENAKLNFEPYYPLWAALGTSILWPFIAYSIKFSRHKAYQCYLYFKEKTVGIPPSSNQEMVELTATNRQMERKYLIAINKYEEEKGSREHFEKLYNDEKYELNKIRINYQALKKYENPLFDAVNQPVTYKGFEITDKMNQLDFDFKESAELFSIENESPDVLKILLNNNYLRIGDDGFSIITSSVYGQTFLCLMEKDGQMYSLVFDRSSNFEIFTVAGHTKNYYRVFIAKFELGEFKF